MPTSLPPSRPGPAPAGPAPRPRRCPGNRSSRICRRRPAGLSCVLAASTTAPAASAAAAPAPAPSPSPSAVRRTPAYALLLLLLLGAGPRSGCLANPVPAAPCPGRGHAARSPARTGVCSHSSLRPTLSPRPPPAKPSAALPRWGLWHQLPGEWTRRARRARRGPLRAVQCGAPGGLTKPLPFGVGDGSGLLARVDADPGRRASVSSLPILVLRPCQPGALGALPFQGLVATLASIYFWHDHEPPSGAPLSPWPSHPPLEPGLGARPGSKEGPAFRRPWQDVDVLGDPYFVPLDLRMSCKTAREWQAPCPVVGHFLSFNHLRALTRQLEMERSAASPRPALSELRRKC